MTLAREQKKESTMTHVCWYDNHIKTKIFHMFSIECSNIWMEIGIQIEWKKLPMAKATQQMALCFHTTIDYEILSESDFLVFSRLSQCKNINSIDFSINIAHQFALIILNNSRIFVAVP